MQRYYGQLLRSVEKLYKSLRLSQTLSKRYLKKDTELMLGGAMLFFTLVIIAGLREKIFWWALKKWVGF